MERLCTLADNGGHTPDHEISRNWQESFFLSWYDAQSQSGGYQHVDIQPFKNRACVWSWIAARGRIVSRYQSLNLALPTTDISNFTAGPITVETAPGPLPDDHGPPGAGGQWAHGHRGRGVPGLHPAALSGHG